jgi:hypothetical protein
MRLKVNEESMSFISINKSLSRREWVIVALYILLFVFGAVIKFPDSAYRGLILTTFNFLHYPAFFILYLLITHSLRFSHKIGHWGPLIASITIAISLELVQPLVARSATWTDALISSAGAFTAFWLARLSNQWQQKQHRERQHRFLVELSVFTLSLVLICIYLLKPVYSASYILTVKHKAFPQLSTHQPPLSFLNWFPLPQGTANTAKLSSQPCPKTGAPPAPDATHCVTVTPIANAWSGAGQVLGFDGWHDYHSLELEILANGEFFLILRIDDQASNASYGDRFNKEIRLVDGFNQISIPLTTLQNLPKRTKPLDLNNIRKLYLFIAPSKQPSTFYIRRIFLAPQ